MESFKGINKDLCVGALMQTNLRKDPVAMPAFFVLGKAYIKTLLSLVMGFIVHPGCQTQSAICGFIFQQNKCCYDSVVSGQASL